jgi:hypothetical protein
MTGINELIKRTIDATTAVHSVVTSLGVALVLLRHSVQLAAVMATDVVLQLVVSYPVELDNVSVLAAQASRW